MKKKILKVIKCCFYISLVVIVFINAANATQTGIPKLQAAQTGMSKLHKPPNFVLHPERIIGNFTAANRFLTNVSKDFIGAGLDRAIIPQKTTREKIEAYLISVRECDKLDGKIILEQRATFAFRSKDCKDRNDWREPVTDTIHGIMFFEWGVQGQKFTGAILGGTGKYAGASGEFHRERLLAPSFTSAETFRITFSELEVPDFYPQ